MTNRRPNGRFPTGVSGNPGGRPRRLLALNAALEDAHDATQVLPVVEKLRELAMAGDVPAARAYLDRVLGPVRRSDEAEEAEDLGAKSWEELLEMAQGIPGLREAFARTAGQGDGDGADGPAEGMPPPSACPSRGGC